EDSSPEYWVVSCLHSALSTQHLLVGAVTRRLPAGALLEDRGHAFHQHELARTRERGLEGALDLHPELPRALVLHVRRPVEEGVDRAVLRGIGARLLGDV